MEDRYLRRQIEQIADESVSSKVSVIVQMQTAYGLHEFLQGTTELIEARRAVTSARDLVPPGKNELRVNMKGNISPAAKRLLEHTNAVAAKPFLATDVIKPLGQSELETLGIKSLKPLLESSWVRKANRSEMGPSKPSHRKPRHFALSGSAVLNITKDDLVKLPQNVAMIADIFPNRVVRVPPVAKATSVPRVVEDNKANTWGLAKTGALSAWGAFGARGDGAIVAILDTGVDADHPDLQGKIAGFAEFGDDGRMIKSGLNNAYDSDAHGTHCAGVVVGGSASGRWIGMAPEARVMCGLVLKDGLGTDAQILAGMEWAISSGAHVISMSLGGLRMTADVLDTYTRTIINANRLGIPVVVAIGNEGSQTTSSPGNDYFAFTVGATDSEDWAAGFSGGRTQVFENSRYIQPNYLPLVYSKPDVTAPGVEIYSSVPKGKWEAWNGTSMATPHVAGAMALLLGSPTKIIAEPPSQRSNLLQSLLISTVKELGESGQNHRFGYGRIDVLRALGYARELGYF